MYDEYEVLDIESKIAGCRKIEIDVIGNYNQSIWVNENLKVNVKNVRNEEENEETDNCYKF